MKIAVCIALLFSLAMLLTAGEPYRAAEADWGKAVEDVTLKKGVLGFGDLPLGMTRAQAEKALGKALPVHKEEVSACGEWITGPLPADGYTFDLQFSGQGADSVVQSIAVRPAPGEYPTDRPSVLDRIKKRLPDLVFVPSVHEPDLAESEAWSLTYVRKNDPSRAVFFNLSWGLVSVTLTECLD